MGFIKNKGELTRNIQAEMTSLQIGPVKLYRQIVWEIFQRILAQTPQGTGLAVANWKIGIGSPDLSWDPSEGDDQRFTATGNLSRVGRRAKGDPKWIQQALDHNKFLIRQIKAGDKVYISNAVRGDDDHGDSSTAYLADLQEAGYWAKKLRGVNKPYETAHESAIFVALQYLDGGKHFPLKDLEFSE